ncbi:MAG: biopolymer transporter ExbD [Candidatus Omnitrophica bacterium]|nr:biopolymer transporter ExbD [Candidatus Omnitrophota bacterium]
MILEAGSSFSLRRRTARKVTINITSLIDVMFMLIIFFVITSTFDEQSRIQLDLPKSLSAEVAQTKPWTLSIDRDEKVYLNDEPVERGDLAARLVEGAAGDPDKTLVLRADQAVRYGLVIEILDVAKQAGLKKISAVTLRAQPVDNTP